MIIEALTLSATLIAIYMTGMFILSLIKKDNSIVDTAYGIGFVIVTWSTFSIFGSGSLVQIIVSSLITIWGLRLSTRIYLRNKGKPEDFRYKNWRDTWKWFKTRSFFQIYVLQGAIILGISFVAIFTNSHMSENVNILLVVVGALVWLDGFLFESIGDYQLDQYIKKQAAIKAAGQTPPTTVMTTGLWSLTRHPNYFGEVAMWWGLFIITLSLSGGWMTIISPLIITYLLLKVSGIPMLEAKYKGNSEYEEYQRKTNAFFPWPSKK